MATGGWGRSTASVLFTDLVGSTELRSNLGDHAAEELRRKHDRLLADAVERHHGQVVKGLGDGVMATFAGVADAVAAAVSIQRLIDRHNRTADGRERLDVRIGLSTGDVSFEGGDCFGTPVVEAARLCAAARGAQILAADVVRLLAGAAGGHRFSPVVALDLKGLPAPIEAAELDWGPDAGFAVPLPPALERPGSFRFVGRRAERELLDRAWKKAQGGERQVVLLAGEPGIGKTRLAAEVARTVHGEGAAVLYGRCDEDLGVPYQPFADALQAYMDTCPIDDLRSQLGPLGPELIRLAPGLRERLPGLPEPLQAEPETERYRLLEAVRQLVAHVSEAAPALMVLDDLHWAARPTLILLHHLARARGPLRLLLVGTFRDTDVAPDHPLAGTLAELRREPDVERLMLEGLDEAEVTAFLEATAGHPLDDDARALARAVHAETEGNPFFVGEMLRHLAESGTVVQREGRWVAEGIPGAIPEGVREVIGRRLSRLPERDNEVLATAAVIGREVRPRAPDQGQRLGSGAGARRRRAGGGRPPRGRPPGPGRPVRLRPHPRPLDPLRPPSRDPPSAAPSPGRRGHGVRARRRRPGGRAGPPLRGGGGAGRGERAITYG